MQTPEGFPAPRHPQAGCAAARCARPGTARSALPRSHAFSRCPQHWTLLGASLLNCLLSAACSVGLALAIALTVHSRGTHLVRGCNSAALPADARAAIATNDCPFNTTRIYVSVQGQHALLPSSSSLCFLLLFLRSHPSLLPTLSSSHSPAPFSPLLSPVAPTAARGQPGRGEPRSLRELRPSARQDTALALWFPSMLLAVTEAVLSGRCCLVALILRGIGPCARSCDKEQVRAGGPDGSLCPTVTAVLKVLGAAGPSFSLERAVQQWDGGYGAVSRLYRFYPAVVTDWHPFVLGSRSPASFPE